jgi:hypothetical protein
MDIKCHNPTLKECEDDTHTLEMGTWEFKVQLQGSKHFALTSSLHCWKGLEV